MFVQTPSRLLWEVHNTMSTHPDITYPLRHNLHSPGSGHDWPLGGMRLSQADQPHNPAVRQQLHRQGQVLVVLAG